ncbi:MAG TPA: universal stress protein [Gaiellaceae bacterium]|jgi:APA family basic amino acid/polyamine antiporter
MARKLPQLQRVLDAPALASVAYGEVASSIYFALGIIAAHALGLTPAVLAVMGVLFLLVALSYAEGTTSIRETGGAATFVRIAFNDLAGFLTGWVLFLDYLIVIALSALFMPHYLGTALHVGGITHKPWDVVVAVTLIAVIALTRIVRRPSLYTFGVAVPVLDLVTQVALVVFGFVILFSPHALTAGTSIGTSPTWHQIAFALPLAMLAYTGLETVANFAEEVRSPGRDLPRSLFGAFGLVVVIYVLIALVGLSAFPAEHGTTELGTTWLYAPLVGIVSALHGHVPDWFQSTLRVYVGLTGALVLFAAATTSISGFSRLAYSLGEHGQLPPSFGRLNRRTLVSPQAILSAAGVAIVMVVATAWRDDQVSFLASLFSFGVLLAFTAAQLAVIRLRRTKPDLRRPFRVPLDVRGVPAPAAIGAAATVVVFVVAMVTHAGARYGGPIWLVVGLAVYGLVRHERGAGLLEHIVSADEQELPQATFSSILVPMKLGEIGEEMVATAVKLAQERNAAVEALYVIRVPLDQPLDAPMTEQEERAWASISEAKLLGEDHGVEVRGETVRARSIGDAIVSEARRTGADLIVLGSAPRWRRQSRFFSPTVDYVLRKAPCEVLIVAFPQGVLEEA